MQQNAAKRSKRSDGARNSSLFILNSALPRPAPFAPPFFTLHFAVCISQGPPLPPKKYSKVLKSSQNFANGPARPPLIKHTLDKSSVICLNEQ
jgi:hypothetical protein